MNFRYEIKMVFSDEQMQHFYEWVYCITTASVSYPPRYVNSIYFDDINYTSVRDNLAGIHNRKKYRVRYYDDSSSISSKAVNFEIKYKIGRVGHKEIYKLSIPRHAMSKMRYCDLQDTIINGLDYSEESPIIDYIVPTLKVEYKRLYFETIDGIRITVDNMINYSLPVQSDFILEGICNNYDKTIVELKFDLDKKSEVARLLGESSFTPKRHSKYLSGLAMYGLVNYY